PVAGVWVASGGGYGRVVPAATGRGGVAVRLGWAAGIAAAARRPRIATRRGAAIAAAGLPPVGPAVLGGRTGPGKRRAGQRVVVSVRRGSRGPPLAVPDRDPLCHVRLLTAGAAPLGRVACPRVGPLGAGWLAGWALRAWF